MKLELEKLQNGLPTLTENMGKFLSESALFCLTRYNHESGVTLPVKNDQFVEINLEWNFQLDERATYTYRDLEEVTEYGATGIAILLSIIFTDNNTVERSFKGGGFDFWLGKKEEDAELPFQRMARLEISGILKGTVSELNSRTKLKVAQTNVSDNTGYSAYICVIEFSNPMANFKKK